MAIKLASIIPSKGRSTRLPRKNLIDFFGSPLIEFTIKAALDAKVFSKIYVSTEDQEVAGISDKYSGVTTVRRPEKLAVDPATVMDVCNHVLDSVEEDFDYVFIMLPSTPLRSYKDVQNISRIIQDKGPNAVISVTEFPLSPIYSYTLDKRSRLTRAFPDLSDINSHTAPKYYVDNGGIYALKQDLVRNKEYCPDNTLPYVMPQWASVDIDTPDDLELAKAMYSYFVKDSEKNRI